MNQQANDIKKNIGDLTNNLTALATSLDSMLNKSFENISPEIAVQYADALKNAKVGDKITKTRKELEELKNIFK